MNSYVRTTIKKDMWVKSDSQSEKKLKEKLWKQCYSKLPGIPKSVNQNNEPVDIAHDPSLPINVDGEPCLQTPARIEFHPKQLWLRGSKDVSWDVS